MVDPVRDLQFDPADGNVIRHPPGGGYGFWAGGSKVSFDPASGTFALFYRERTPLEKGRGGRAAVALSQDGFSFDDVWEVSKEALDSTSIEVGHCLRHDEGEWRLYVSYERSIQRTWRIDVIRAAHPQGFQAQSRRTVLEPSMFGIGFIKDPWVIRDEQGGYELFAAVPARQGPRSEGKLLKTRPEDATVLAVSGDGLHMPTLEYVFEPTGEDNWHGHRGRLDSLFRYGGHWVGTFSGGRTFYDQYEEWCGLVESPDRRSIRRIETPGPWVRSPYGSVRYVYGLAVESSIFFYYEYTRADGAHDLRVSAVPVK